MYNMVTDLHKDVRRDANRGHQCRPCALTIASSAAHTEVLRLLLDHFHVRIESAGVSETGLEIVHPLLLHYAVNRCHVETAFFLLCQPDTNPTDVTT